MTIAFFGHAKYVKIAEHEQKILDFLEEKVGDMPADMFLGGYGEFDAFAYECCKKYQATHPNISLFFITPYMEESYLQKRADYLNKAYDGIIYPEIEDKPIKFAIFYRNRWIVEKSDYVICAVSHNYGGAYKAYSYALRKNRRVFNIL